MDCHFLGHVTRHDSNALQYPAFEITPWQEASVSRALQNVKSLILAVKGGLRFPAACEKMKTLLGYMSNLTSLRFNGNSTLQR
jgi:hypothetical protein